MIWLKARPVVSKVLYVGGGGVRNGTRTLLKGYSSCQSHFSEINVKLAEKNKYATHSVQRSLEMCENKGKPSVSEDFRQKTFYQ